ncbi:hypothetical protein M422DRAFT_31476 [Sphaerobolus stellatus SS14]|uniref:F-box domain-containing protein n=1 Tax=Sphaerobolus stellatus (strain SS14) TaxID=990650 RepID=A0A0C9VKA0_SPHS4|nr:hypothetical protein M422DRAFT_31476 [Sphaerobolus stellatus SS14]
MAILPVVGTQRVTINDLPYELLLLIFIHTLPKFKHNVFNPWNIAVTSGEASHVVRRNLSLVCRYWNGIIIDRPPSLYTSIILLVSSKMRFFHNFNAAPQKLLKRLILPSLQLPLDIHIKAQFRYELIPPVKILCNFLGNYMGRIRSLILDLEPYNSCDILGELLVAQDEGGITNAPYLERLHLWLSGWRVSARTYNAYARTLHAPRLKSLVLSNGFRGFTPLLSTETRQSIRSVLLETVSISDLAALSQCPNLAHFFMKFGEPLNNPTVFTLPSVTHAEFPMPSLTETYIRQVHVPQIFHLCLNACNYHIVTKVLRKSGTTLQSLKLIKVDLRNLSYQTFFADFDNIRSLELENCPLTGMFFGRLQPNKDGSLPCPKLEVLCVKWVKHKLPVEPVRSFVRTRLVVDKKGSVTGSLKQFELEQKEDHHESLVELAKVCKGRFVYSKV